MQEDSDVEEKEGEEVPTAGVPWEVLVECLTFAFIEVQYVYRIFSCFMKYG